MADVIKSISYDQSEILNWIIALYLDGCPFELDPTYSTGQFYKHGVPEPDMKLDIHPQVDDCLEVDVRDLPFPDNSIKSCIFDPPFLANSPNRKVLGKMRERFSSPYKNQSGLMKFYQEAISEVYRVLINGGILVFKCQDMVDGGKQKWNHTNTQRMAEEIGFYAEDLFILLAKSRMIPKSQIARHARRFHCYFWIFRKI